MLLPPVPFELAFWLSFWGHPPPCTFWVDNREYPEMFQHQFSRIKLERRHTGTIDSLALRKGEQTLDSRYALFAKVWGYTRIWVTARSGGDYRDQSVWQKSPRELKSAMESSNYKEILLE